MNAPCGCAAMAVRPEQADELHSMFKTWRQHYWVAHGAEPGVRVALQRAERLGEIVPRYPHGVAALPARGRAGDDSGRSRVGDAGRIVGRSDSKETGPVLFGAG